MADDLLKMIMALAPQLEDDFQKDYRVHAAGRGIDPDADHPLNYYDNRAAWLMGLMGNDHSPSIYKRAGHPRTYLNEQTDEGSAFPRPGFRDTRK